MMRSAAIIDPLNCFATKDESFYCKHNKPCYKGLNGYGLEVYNQPVTAVNTPVESIKNIRETFLTAANCLGTRLILEEGLEEIEQVTAGSPHSQFFGERFPDNIVRTIQFDQPAFLNRKNKKDIVCIARITGFILFLKSFLHEITGFAEEQFNEKMAAKNTPLDDTEPKTAICIGSSEKPEHSIPGFTDISTGRQRCNLYWKPK